MAKRGRFEFELYRLNIADSDQILFNQSLPTLAGDDAAIIDVLRSATSPDFSYMSETPTASYRWDLRNFADFGQVQDNRVVGVSLARSMTEAFADIVTDSGIVEGTSESVPPRADHIELFFHMSRHMVAIERYTPITGSGRWLRALEGILDQVVRQKEYRGRIELEPYPPKEEIMQAFFSFQILTRLRVRLRIPNPELSRYAQHLYQEMANGGIREYLVDMKSKRGLNKDHGLLPHSAAELAKNAYKKGPVQFEGIREGKPDRVQTGGRAARGSLSELRTYIRGLKDNAKAKETQSTLESVLGEIDRIAPRPDGEDTQS